MVVLVVASFPVPPTKSFNRSHNSCPAVAATSAEDARNLIITRENHFSNGWGRLKNAAVQTASSSLRSLDAR